MWVISFFCPFPLSFSLHPTPSPPSPVVKGHTGKMKPNRGEKWNIDFFFSFFYLHWTPDGVFRFLLFHASSSLFFSKPCLELSVITSHNSLAIRSVVPWWGLRRSWLFIVENIVCEIERVTVCVFVCFSEPCSSWPVPDDQEPRRFSQHPRCPGDRVQKRFVPVSPVDASSVYLLYL